MTYAVGNDRLGSVDIKSKFSSLVEARSWSVWTLKQSIKVWFYLRCRLSPSTLSKSLNVVQSGKNEEWPLLGSNQYLVFQRRLTICPSALQRRFNWKRKREKKWCVQGCNHLCESVGKGACCVGAISSAWSAAANVHSPTFLLISCFAHPLCSSLCCVSLLCIDMYKRLIHGCMQYYIWWLYSKLIERKKNQ